ncbi:MAG TPA: AraC family transcriptional regulator [Candidatus Acidoferrum sp.]|nr:AraC family transcriptional regulator [Candidatus Acidoferrum sp.]
MSDSRPLSELRYLRHPALPGVELLVANPSFDTWHMFHERYLLCGCTSVATSWVYRRKTHVIEDGATAFMEPGEVHRVVAKPRPSHFLALFVERDAFLKLAEEAGVLGVPHFRVADVSSPRLLQDLTHLSDSLQEDSDPLELQSLLVGLVHEALTYAECRPPALKPLGPGLKRSLDRARVILEERINELITLDELAKAAALSRFHLVRSFAQQFGLPPHAYQIHVRIKRACHLLRDGLHCVEVAPSVGFADQSHFTRHFKRIMGVTPSVYAASHTAPSRVFS